MDIDEEAEQLAKQYKINLKNIKGTGKNGEITLQDVQKYIKEKYLPKVKREVKVFGLRKIISERLSKSYREAVHVTENMEVEMDAFVKAREELSAVLKVKPSYTVLLLKCVAAALRDFAELNAAIEENKIIIYDTVNINIAVETPVGLITPVIRDVDKKDIKQLMEEYQDIITRSRNNKLKEKDFMGGTFTVTNLGMYNIDSFNPIINPPQVAILGVNRIVEKPLVKDGKIEIHKVMTLSLTFDHRVIDGALAARFLNGIRGYLENPDRVLAQNTKKGE